MAEATAQAADPPPAGNPEPLRPSLMMAIALLGSAGVLVLGAILVRDLVLFFFCLALAGILIAAGTSQLLRWRRGRVVRDQAPTWTGDPTLVTDPDLGDLTGLDHAGLEALVEPGPLLAEGGMARVMKSTWREDGRVVVWKQAQEGHNSMAVANLHIERESAVLRAVRHERLPTWLADGRVRVGRTTEATVIIQEFIPGQTLLELMQRHYHDDTVVPVNIALGLMQAICDPLELLEARELPIMHGDLKPDNVILHPERGPVVIDLGLSETLSGRHVQRTRAIRGSGTWTAPERLEGWVTPSTDVYTLGKLLFLLLTARTPPDEVEQRHLDWIASKGCPAGWVRLIERSCRKDPVERPVSARRWRKLLERGVD